MVSLRSDDSWADQYEARSTLAAHGIRGTYYVNTGRTGTSGFMSWAQLVVLDADGHEIAGHTLDHVDLVAATATEARRQVCDDRQNLVSRGFVSKIFAYRGERCRGPLSARMRHRQGLQALMEVSLSSMKGPGVSRACCSGPAEGLASVR